MNELQEFQLEQSARRDRIKSSSRSSIKLPGNNSSMTFNISGSCSRRQRRDRAAAGTSSERAGAGTWATCNFVSPILSMRRMLGVDSLSSRVISLCAFLGLRIAALRNVDAFVVVIGSLL